MTEKRFYTDGQYVMQKGEVWVVAGGEHSADVIATALNELIEEKNKLQFDYNMEILTRQSIEKENKLLKHENEHLNLCLIINAMYDTSEVELTKCIAKNEQLKQDRNEMFIRERDARNELRNIKKENEQLIQENKELKEERKGFESCSHNWGILYNEAKNKVEELSKENERLKFQLKECKNNKLFSRRELERENNDLKKQLEDCTQKAKEEIRNCGHCKHFQIDGMFGMWCDINDTDYLLDGKCLNYEENKR